MEKSLFSKIGDWWHNLFHSHWGYERHDIDVRICLSRLLLRPWLWNAGRIQVSVVQTGSDSYITGYLNMDQLKEMLAIKQVDAMKIYLMAQGNGTCNYFEEGE